MLLLRGQPTRLQILWSEIHLPSIARIGRLRYPGRGEVTNRGMFGGNVYERVAGAQARTYLKIKILVQDQGVAEFQPAGIQVYSEELKQGHNAEIGPKDYFEIGSNQFSIYLDSTS